MISMPFNCKVILYIPQESLERVERQSSILVITPLYRLAIVAFEGLIVSYIVKERYFFKSEHPAAKGM